MNEIQQLEQAIKSLEAQRELLGNAVVDVALEPLRQKLAALKNIQNEPAIIDERKLVTVMFADLSGFTALSEKLDPEKVREIMNGCFGVLVPIIERYGGTIDKFIGDEIMALFGAPIARENDAEMALRASLDMMEALKLFNQEQGLQLGMHFGINTGLVVAGGLGSESRQQYSVMGDAVNLAARLEGASEAGQIYIGPTTYKLTAPYFEFEQLAPISLKGKSEPVQIYLLKGIKKTVTRERGIEGLFSPIIGREKDINHIESSLGNLEDRKGGVLLLLGEAGLGKSRLISELRSKYLHRFQWFEGRAFSHTASVSYGLVNSLLDNILKVEKDSPPQAISSVLENFLEKTFTTQSRNLLAYLSRLRGLPINPEFEEIFKDVLPTAIQARMQQAFEELISHLAYKHPMVLVWEDFHWADTSSIQLLQHILQVSKKLPVFFLIVSRPQENVTEWLGSLSKLGINPEKLELSPLTADQSTKLLENLLKIDNLPAHTLEMILSKSEGNPFFLEELLRSLIDTGMVIFESGRITVSEKIQELQVPDTLQGVIAARIDRLPAASKHTLQNASVIGRIFQDSVLKLIIEQEPAKLNLEQSLNELENKTLIRNRESAEYIFKHAITHDVTYQSLLISRRKTLHLLTAKSMEEIFPEQLEELAPTLAFHFSQGGDTSKSSQYFLKAAEKAERNYSNPEALNFYLQAIDEIQKSGEGNQIKELDGYFEKVGGIYSLLGKTQEALQALDHAFANLASGDNVGQARIFRKKGLAFNAARNIPKMIENYLQAAHILGDFDETKDPIWIDEWITLQLDLAWAYYFGNKVRELDTTIEKVNPIIERLGSLAQKNRLYGTLFLSDLRRFRYFQLPDAMIERLDRQLETAKQIGNKALIGRALAYAGFARMWRNEHDLAEAIFLESFTDIAHVGDMDSLLISKTYIALAMRKKGDVSKTITYAEESLELAKKINSHFYIGASYGILGWAAWKMGDRGKADRYLESAIEAYTHFPGSNPVEFIYKGPLLGIAVEDGDWQKAVDYGKSLLGPSQQRMPDAAYGEIEKAIASWESGDMSATGEAFQKLIELFQQAEMGYV